MHTQSLAEIVPLIGSTSLGIVIGWLIRYFIRRFQNYTPQALSSLVGVVVGGGIVKFLGADQTVTWFYPIGLLLGFIIYSFQAYLFKKEDDGTQFAKKPDQK
ncbi:hypothetical protein [Nostoc sp. NMS8]|uniref:hypothetical protein n=1 Tax=Nostoc sp. NMS8 TaxID=2815392 RepID=UPI0025DF62E4|nr:hypothetical protein [Nostoc sp. NMS8]MBN3959640.1 hypothetical protein [Nostoc sp. NMS8]